MLNKKLTTVFLVLFGITSVTFSSSDKTLAKDYFFGDKEMGRHDERTYNWLIRARILGIYPSGDSSSLSPVSTALGGPAKLQARESYIPEIDITYMVRKNIGIELILGVSKNDISSKGTLTPLAAGVVAETWLLPPTLLLQYHCNPDGIIRPYVGVGINVTFAFHEKVKPNLIAGTGLTKLQIDPSVGVALQAGFDYKINEKWFFNVDAKWIQLEPDVKLTGGALGRQTLDVEINPFVIGVGVGVRF